MTTNISQISASISNKVCPSQEYPFSCLVEVITKEKEDLFPFNYDKPGVLQNKIYILAMNLHQKISAFFCAKVKYPSDYGRKTHKKVNPQIPPSLIGKVNFKSLLPLSFWTTTPTISSMYFHIIGHTLEKGNNRKRKIALEIAVINDSTKFYRVIHATKKILITLFPSPHQGGINKGYICYSSVIQRMHEDAVRGLTFPETKFLTPRVYLGTSISPRTQKFQKTWVEDSKEFNLQELIEIFKSGSLSSLFFPSFLPFFQQALSFLRIFHYYGIVHGDFRAKNLLIERLNGSSESYVSNWESCAPFGIISENDITTTSPASYGMDCFRAYGILLPSSDVYQAITQVLFPLMFGKGCEILEAPVKQFPDFVKSQKLEIIYNFIRTFTLLPWVLYKSLPLDKDTNSFSSIPQTSVLLNLIEKKILRLCHSSNKDFSTLCEIWKKVTLLRISLPIFMGNLTLFAVYAENPLPLLSYFEKNIVPDGCTENEFLALNTQTATYLSEQIEIFQTSCETIYSKNLPENEIKAIVADDLIKIWQECLTFFNYLDATWKSLLNS